MSEGRKTGAFGAIVAAVATLFGVILLCWIVCLIFCDTVVSRRIAQARALQVQRQIQAAQAARQAESPAADGENR